MKLKFWAKDQPMKAVKIDIDRMTPTAEKLEEILLKRVIGQERAVKQFVKAFETYEAGIGAPDRPLQTLLFLGPTGVGKTRIVEVFCEHFWNNPEAFIKIDCAEYQHSHETAKLIGAPPGYLGYGDRSSRISQDKLQKHWTKGSPEISVILFDEIEKAHPAVFKIMLGMLDKGRLTLGNGSIVDLRKTIIIMTSNLAADKVAKHLKDNNIGFGHTGQALSVDEIVYRTSMEEVKKFFSPEFVNRVDRIVVFRSLLEEHIARILDLEIAAVQDRILMSGKFVLLDVSKRAKEFLLKEGISVEFGARELRRAVERFLVGRTARSLATHQVESGDMLLVDKEDEAGLSFEVLSGVVDVPQTTLYPTKATPEPDKEVKQQSIIKYEGPLWRRYKESKEPRFCSSCGQPNYFGHLCILQPED